MTYSSKDFAIVESNLVAIQRIKNLTKFTTELDWKQSSEKTNELIISKGQISFNKFSLSYEKFKALTNVSLEINPGEKMLICGKTGSGKSTLAMSLFFLREPHFIDGEIMIDNQSLHNASLESIRKQITVISQVISLQREDFL